MRTVARLRFRINHSCNFVTYVIIYYNMRTRNICVKRDMFGNAKCTVSYTLHCFPNNKRHRNVYTLIVREFQNRSLCETVKNSLQCIFV